MNNIYLKTLVPFKERSNFLLIHQQNVCVKIYIFDFAYNVVNNNALKI